ncbi:hypothetical protein HDZ31DRAFT_75630 [Schizophyllum fasciatum]
MTAKTSSASSEFVFPRSSSPAKEDLRANAHPYAIKTTSTGILSRSNSSPQHPPSHYKSSHHYVPAAPKKSERPTRVHGHRYSRSLTSDSPRPLPAPPVSDSEDNVSIKGVARSETAPVAQVVPQSPLTPSQLLPDDLPPNPKLWTPSQLATYLSTALRVKSGDALQLPKPVAKDIAQFVRDSKITGKAFVRITESDLEAHDISKPWCAALLAASRNLRQNVLKGRIWGFGNDSASGESENDDEDTPNKRRRSVSTSTSIQQPNPFDSDLYSSASSSSSLDLSTNSATRGHYRNGRVKGMIASFERSGSIDEGRPNRRERSDSTASSVDSLPEEPLDEMYLTQRPLPTPPATMKLNSPGNGRALPMPPSIAPSIASDTEGYETAASVAHLDEDEPTMEELLSASGDMTGRRPYGGYAWENAHDTLVTMKRVPVPAPEPLSFAEPMPRIKAGDGKSSGGSKEGKPRVALSLDDIFMVSPSRSSPSRPLPPPPPTYPPILELPATQDKAVTASIPDTDTLEQTRLMADIGVTRSLLEQFRLRLEEVEAKVAEMEEQERQREIEAAKAERKRREKEAAAPPAPRAHWLPVLAGWALHKVGLAPAYDARGRGGRAPIHVEDPTSLRALPPYIFFVGLGVCAVVLRVLLRRVGGKSLLVR